MALEEIGAPTRLEVAWETIPATGTGSSTYCEEVHDDDGKVSYEPSVTVSWRDAAGVRRTTIEHLDPELSYIDITLWTDLETGHHDHNRGRKAHRDEQGGSHRRPVQALQVA